MDDLIEELRIVKDRGEIEAIRKAGIVTADVFIELRPQIRPAQPNRPGGGNRV